MKDNIEDILKHESICDVIVSLFYAGKSIKKIVKILTRKIGLNEEIINEKNIRNIIMIKG